MNQVNQVNQVNSPKLSYRAEIDGLRAIAVVSVILYHAQIVLFGRDWFEGGFIGVDVFFVISGYLITRIILSELESKGSFSFLNFYERRARRILPMLFVVIFVSVPFAWQMLLPSDFVEFAESILASIFFGSNFFFYFSTTEYGADSALLKPFLHTWSLGVEEQFYLVFPILAIVAFRYFRKHFLTILVGLSLLSLQFAELMEVRNSDLNFYLPFSRFWELAVGSMLAYRELNYKPLNKSFASKSLPMLGLYLIVYSILFFDAKTPHPSFHTLIPIIGVALIIGFASNDELVGKVLGSKAFVWIGLISYSAYMWHFPIFAFSRMGKEPTNYDKFEWIALTFALSVLSYFLVEKSFRDSAKFSKNRFFITVGLFSVAVVVGSFSIVKYDGYGSRFNLIASDAKQMQFYRKKYWDDFSRFYNKKPNELIEFERTSKINVYVIGNSWAHDIANAISYSDKYLVQFKGMSGYLCNEFILPSIGEKHKDFARWKDRCFKNNSLFESIPKNTDLVVIADNIFSEKQYEKELVRDAFESNISKLQSNFDGKIVIIKGRPKWKSGGFELMLRFGPPSDYANRLVQPYSKINLNKLKSIDNYYSVFYENYGVEYFSLVDAFCDDTACKLFDGNNVLYFDGAHLTLQGSEYITDYLRSKL